MLSRTLSGWGRLLGLGRSSNATEEDRRLWGRIPCDVETTGRLAHGKDTQAMPARLRNVSRGGVSLTVGRAFEPGTLLSVTIPLGEDTELLVCVVRCESAEGGLWDLGGTFAAQLSDDDLRSLGARREKSNSDDQRVWARFTCPATAAYRIVRTGSDSSAVAVLNISASGIALQVGEPIRVGELLNLELSRDGQLVLTTLASVVRTGHVPGGANLLGCNFISELQDEQVQRLL